ncbi:hypothetical protein XELAEV_18044432mg [Xenopus laevis]|uniref:Uncharacterized protein n=1 Tax=Xenopus laevis TaxID=8355 RepID=A0A974H389_XENLA|nr:hypothetical protein XELAEV_18044432mg [Xenopus laevis]
MNYLEDTSPCPLSEEESRLAYRAKQKALDILIDALKKRDSVLVEKAGENTNSVGRRPSLTPHLVHSLRKELKQVTFVKVDHPFYAICYIYPRSHERRIYLGPRFWKQGEILGADSRPGLLIEKAAQFLLDKTPTDVQGQRHEPRQIRYEFERVLKHWGIYNGHFYSCCGETVRDSVCECSFIRPWTLSEEEWNLAEEAKQRTLMILFDALEKKESLLVENPEDFVGLERLNMCPLIPLNLVKDLITNLASVTFRKGYNVNYVLPYLDKIIIYLSHDFWQQNEMLECGSRPGTLILELSQLLGYKRYLKEPADEGEQNKVQQQPHKFPLTAFNICWVFETWMRHRGVYSGSYACCGEESRDSVCALSHLAVCLNDITPPPLTPERTLEPPYYL